MNQAKSALSTVLVAFASLWGACGSTSEKMVEVVSDPPGARIFVDGVDTGQVTPARMPLVFGSDRSQRVFLQLMKDGHRPVFEAFYSYNVPQKPKEYELKR